MEYGYNLAYIGSVPLTVLMVVTTEMLYGKGLLGSTKAFLRFLSISKNAFFANGGASDQFHRFLLVYVDLTYVDNS